MKFRLLHDRVVIRCVEGNGTSNGVEGSIVAGRLRDAKDTDLGSAQTRLVEFKALSNSHRQKASIRRGGRLGDDAR